MTDKLSKILFSLNKGERHVYHMGRAGSLPKRIGQVARDMMGRGHVTLCQKRNPDNIKQFLYIAEGI